MYLQNEFPRWQDISNKKLKKDSLQGHYPLVLKEKNGTYRIIKKG
jgi:hypothetical protein